MPKILQGRPATTGVSNEVWIALLVLAACRIFVPWEVLDLVEHYGRSGGSFLEKIHFATYGMFLLSVLLLMFDADRNSALHSRALIGMRWLALGTGLTITLIVATDRTQGASYLLDSILLAAPVAIIVARMSPRQLDAFFRWTLWLLVFNDMVLLFEFITHFRLVPYGNQEAFFRPTAFLGHPLLNGLLNVTAIPFAFLAAWSLGRKLLVATIFLTACFVAGARAASVAGVATMTVCMWMFLRQQVVKRKIDEGTLIVGAIAVLVLVTVGVIVAAATGLADRLIQYGFSDQSALARISIYDALDYMSWKEVLFGMTREQYEFLTTMIFSNNAVESPFMMYIFGFGAIGGTILVFSIARYLWGLSAGKPALLKVGVIVFTVVASTNNTFAGKTSALTFITLLAMTSVGQVDKVRKVLGRRT